ncbi:antibiotic biosynthesis monooxygenase [Spirosoma sp. HMF4905]|uniref:Antibiotic biosynthesis monooxygenase n=1 Tax=Spirosoma arboris TaxID=2682092 RepID=A0A7K1SC69_9BACT|nr:putative quinol monooxygenase [Spirosoma arboris]MVM31156.1 antibiotic biosynthesis monooxygenase [Spirosoma arboris]
MNGGVINTIAEWRTKDGQLETVLKLLADVAEKSTEEEGNLFYTVYQSYAAPNTLFLVEGYKDETALDKHRDSAHFQGIVVEKIVPLLESRTVVRVSALNLDDFKKDE